jgi:ferredoxin-NADP reductase
MELVVSKVIQEAESILSFEMRHVTGEMLPAYEAGSHISVMLPFSGGAVEERHYSLIGDPADLTAYRIAVLREADGRGGSEYMHTQVSEGSRLEVRGPSSDFKLVPDAAHSILVAGGIGITPLLSFLRQLKAQHSSFEMHYAGKSAARMALCETVRELAGEKVGFYESLAGTRLQLSHILAKPKADSHVYVCGPNRLIAAVLETASNLGWLPRQIHFESFGPRWEPNDQPIRVELAQSGIELEVPVGLSILAAIEAAGIWAPSECRRGECAMCVATVIEGDIAHRDHCLKSEERLNAMCICVSWARSPKLVLDL